MKKTVDNLTENELEIVQEFMDAFGLTMEEALQASIAEGAITEGEGGLRFAPEGFEELKFYVVNNKSHYYKINKQLKKDKKEEMFTEDHFYFGTKITKADDGYDLEKCTTTDLGETPKVIILSNYFKGKRATFDGAGKAEATNLETSLAKSLSKADQEQMLVLSGNDKGKSVKVLRDALTKAHKEIPEKLKIKFRVITFGLVEVDGEWKRFYFESASRFNDEQKTAYHFDKDLAGKAIKSKYICELARTGSDDNDNAVIQILVKGEGDKALLDSIKDEINGARKDMLAYVKGQYDSAKSGGNDGAKSNKSSDEDEEENDPFES